MSDKHVVLSCHFDSDELLLIAGFVDRPSSSKWRMIWPIANRKNSSNLDDNIPVVNVIAARKFKLDGILQGYVHTAEDFANSFRKSIKEFLENDLEIHDKAKAKEVGIPIREDVNCVAISQVLLSKINDSIVHEKEYISNLLIPLIKNDFFDQDHEPYIPNAFETNASVARLFEDDILSAKYSLNINLGFKSTGIIFIDSSDPEHRVQQTKQFFMGYVDLINSHRSYLQENYLNIYETPFKRINSEYQKELNRLNQDYANLHQKTLGNLPARHNLDKKYTQTLAAINNKKRTDSLRQCRVYNAQEYHDGLIRHYDFYPETPGYSYKLYFGMNIKVKDTDRSLVFTLQNLISKAYQQFRELDSIRNVRFRSDFLENFQVSLSGYFADLTNIKKTVLFLFTKLYLEDREQYLKSKMRLSMDNTPGVVGDSLLQLNIQTPSPSKANQGTVNISGDSLTAGSGSLISTGLTSGLPTEVIAERKNAVLYPKLLGITDFLPIKIIQHRLLQYSHPTHDLMRDLDRRVEKPSRAQIIRGICRGFTEGFENKVRNSVHAVSHYYDVEQGKELTFRNSNLSADDLPLGVGYRDAIYKSFFNEYSVAAGMILMNYDLGESKPISVIKKSVGWVKNVLKFD